MAVCRKNSTESPGWRIRSENEYGDYSQPSGSTIPTYEMSKARITSQKNRLWYTDDTECHVPSDYKNHHSQINSFWRS